jgi:hypothetical protein
LIKGKNLKTYTESQGNGKMVLDIEEAVNLMLSKYEVVSQMCHGFGFREYEKANTRRRMAIIIEACLPEVGNPGCYVFDIFLKSRCSQKLLFFIFHLLLCNLQSLILKYSIN